MAAARSVDHSPPGHFTPDTAICNATGLPAISAPPYQGDDGLPIGVQPIGPPAREQVLGSWRRNSSAHCPGPQRRPEGASGVSGALSSEGPQRGAGMRPGERALRPDDY